MSRNHHPSEIRVSSPDWIDSQVDFERVHADDESRMRLAIMLARENVLHETGGPFGAAVFEAESGKLVAVGVNRVVPLQNSVLHAEIVAFMMAQASVGSYTLADTGVAHELFTSCEPCAMCLGATLWSGVSRVVWAATRDDAFRLAFDEGPVFPQSYDYLRRRGIEFREGLLRDEARAVFALYQQRGGAIYNG